jgi:CheY-like chemotaxis protein
LKNNTSQLSRNNNFRNMRELNILLVDDQILNLEILELVLQSKYKVSLQKASNGKIACEMVVNQDGEGVHGGFDVIFMDCNMPIMDGYEASIEIRKLYSEGIIKKLPCICALTAYTTIEFK